MSICKLACITIAYTNNSNRDQQNTSSLKITAGFTSSVDIFLDIENAGDDAFQAILSFILPASTLQLVNVFNQTRKEEVSDWAACDNERG